MESQLTIAIPTYNRNAILADRLPALLAQMRPGCRLVIVDDHSDAPVADTLQPLLAKHSNAAAHVVSNRANVGICGNVLKCFELCESRWLWILGDDDFVEPQALEAIFRCLQQYPDAVTVNFSTRIHAFDRTRRCRGRAEFLEQFHFGNSLLVSTNLYRRDCLDPFLKIGHLFQYTVAPHLAMVLLALQPGSESILHMDSIVDWSPSANDQHAEFLKRMDYNLMYLGLTDLPLSAPERKLLFRAVRQGTGLRSQTRNLLRLYSRPEEFHELRYRFDTMMLRWIYHERSLARRMAFYLFKVMVRFPRVLAFLFRMEAAYKRLEAKAKGKKEVSSSSRDEGTR